MPSVDETEARRVAAGRLNELRGASYQQLVAEWLGEPRSEYATGPSGLPYQLEIEAVWDDRRKRNLRVWVLVDDGGASETRPLSEDFIMAPDGTFIGE
jgi:hypothetical protein